MSDSELEDHGAKSSCGICCCIRSIPWGSLSSVLIAAVGFSLSASGWGATTTAFQNFGLDLGAVRGYVGYALGATLALDLCILIFAFCATGKTREACLGGRGKGKSCGRCCMRFFNAMFAFLCYVAIAWNLVLMLLFALMVILQFVFSELCNEADALSNDFTLNLKKFGFGFDISTPAELTNFCKAINPLVGHLALMFAGSVISVFAQTNMLVNVCVNFVRLGYEGRKLGKENTRLSLALLDEEQAQRPY